MNNILEIIGEKHSFWNQCGFRNDIVLSTRVRLARNACEIAFPDIMTENDFQLQLSVIDKFKKFQNFDDGVFLKIKDLELHEKRLLRERNIITRELEMSPNSGVFVSRERNFSILVNDEDHFRIQVIKSGFQLHESYKIANIVDDELNKYVSYAFLEDYGFLSQCPANVGTGLKISVILHLPVLTMQKKVDEHMKLINDKNFILSGTLGNLGSVVGSMYVISNQNNLGLSEIDIIDNADDVISSLIKSEDERRDEFFHFSYRELEDSLWKSIGIILYAKRLSYIEAIEHLSKIRLGIIMSVIKEPDINMLDDFMVRIQWSHLQEYYGRRFNTVIENDECRAQFLKEEFQKLEI